jgi:branched-chain amino acid transport system substrate-binding protein
MQRKGLYDARAAAGPVARCVSSTPSRKIDQGEAKVLSGIWVLIEGVAARAGTSATDLAKRVSILSRVIASAVIVAASAVIAEGGKSWYFITADYAFGYALERDTASAVQAAGGKVLGSVRAPLGTADFSSYLVQAQASGAKVIGFANAGTDTQNCVKQAAEFGLTANGTKLATLLMQISDVISLGQKVSAGLNYTDSFYWDMTDKTREWSKRWAAKLNADRVPGLLHAGQYAATLHWLKAVKEVGSTDADAVVAKMKATPVNDFYNTNVQVREDGRVMHTMYLWQVKKAAESKNEFDLCEPKATIAPADAWRPLSEGGCPLIKA